MNQLGQEWWIEYRRLSDALSAYGDPIAPKYRGDADAKNSLTEPERLFLDLWFYWDRALVNNGDMFSWLGFILGHKADLAAIGAAGTLEAIDRLMPFYLEQQQAENESARAEYWRRTKEEREPLEAIAEEVNEFAKLLLRYAQNNLGTPGELQPPRIPADVAAKLPAGFWDSLQDSLQPVGDETLQEMLRRLFRR